MPMSLFRYRAAACGPGLLRKLWLRLERARLASRIGELRGLVDVPHDLADGARARIARLARRARALDRLIG